MANVVIMPKQGQSVESCVITKWHKSVGAQVSAGDILFSYETDKATFDEESQFSGTMLAVLADEGDDVPCLSSVCVIGEEGEDVSALVGRQEPPAPAAQEAKEAPRTVPAQKNDGGGGRISPRAKMAAERQGVDAALASPTGPGGRIIERDVYRMTEQAATSATGREVSENVTEPGGYTDEKLSGVRKAIARAMHESLSAMAQLTHQSSFDATRMLELRKRIKASGGETGVADITLNDMILFGVSRVLKNHPAFNAYFLDTKMRLFHSVNLGIAVDTDRGLLVPTLYGADKLSLREMSRQAKQLIAAAKSGGISPELLTNGTFTVTNLGSLGVESFTPVINPPQTAILGVCAIVPRVKETDGRLASYPAMGLSLTYDHRAVDGAPAARFVKELSLALENFEMLLAM